MTLLCSQMTGDSNDLLGKDAASQRGKQDPCAPATSSPHRTHSGFRNINLFFWFSCLLFPLSSYCFLCASPSLVCQQNLYSPFRTQLRHRLPQEPSPLLPVHSESSYPPPAPTGPRAPLLFLSPFPCLLCPRDYELPKIEDHFTFIPASPFTEVNKLPSTW